jgi:flagellar biosynthesis/type III secretory pathway chaperone
MDTDILADLIHRKHQFLVQLHGLGRRQCQFVTKGDITSLLDVLAVKQGILTELQRIEIALGPFRGQKPEERSWRSAAERGRTAAELDECQRVLAEIVEQEKQSEEALVRRRDETAVQLQEVGLASRARNAYAFAPSAPRRQIDLLSDS